MLTPPRAGLRVLCPGRVLIWMCDAGHVERTNDRDYEIEERYGEARLF